MCAQMYTGQRPHWVSSSIPLLLVFWWTYWYERDPLLSASFCGITVLSLAFLLTGVLETQTQTLKFVQQVFDTKPPTSGLFSQSTDPSSASHTFVGHPPFMTAKASHPYFHRSRTLLTWSIRTLCPRCCMDYSSITLLTSHTRSVDAPPWCGCSMVCLSSTWLKIGGCFQFGNRCLLSSFMRQMLYLSCVNIRGGWLGHAIRNVHVLLSSSSLHSKTTFSLSSKCRNFPGLSSDGSTKWSPFIL